MYPIRARFERDGISTPRTRALPLVADARPTSSRISVVLPDPFGPSSP
jgi:hypothetical protein